MMHRHTENIDSLLDEIRFKADDSDTVLETMVRRVIIRFCEATHFWQEEIGPIRIISGIESYELLPSRHQSIVQIEKVKTEIDGESVLLQNGTNTGVTPGFYKDSPFSIVVYPNDTLAGKDINVTASLKPKFYGGVFRFSETIIDEYFDAIVSGVLTCLYLTPNREYTNPDLGGYYKNEFEAQLSYAKVRVANHFQRETKPIIHKARPFF